jgi:uncharacterized protein (TIGR03083 family)
MENSRFLDCLDADYRRLREVVPERFDAAVPTCPGWTVADLTRHVAQVYQHKVELMRHGQEPDVWPPAGFAETDPVLLLDQGYAGLVAEFTARGPAAPTKTWYGPDQTVGFWFRRMAQETAMHRIDAELGAGASIRPVPEDLAVDGIDELLTTMVRYAFTEWPEDFTAVLEPSPGRTLVLRADPDGSSPGAAWLVRTGPGRLTIGGGPGTPLDASVRPDVTVSGTPAAMLRWAWNREAAEGGPGQAGSVLIDGDPAAVTDFRRCVAEATQ